MNKPIKKAASQAASGKTLPIDYTLKKNNIVNCGVHRLNTIRNELARNGLSLSDVSAQNQQKTLFRTLEYLGARGINTPEGEACGYLKIASRIKELKEIGRAHV